MNFVGREFRAEGVMEAIADERDGEVRNVYAHPTPLQSFGDIDGGAAAAERIKHYIAFVG